MIVKSGSGISVTDSASLDKKLQNSGGDFKNPITGYITGSYSTDSAHGFSCYKGGIRIHGSENTRGATCYYVNNPYMTKIGIFYGSSGFVTGCMTGYYPKLIAEGYSYGNRAFLMCRKY